MAMMISKFNKIIHNKTVWLVFAIFISIAFVSLYTGGGSNNDAQQAQRESQLAGRLFGEDVSRAEYGNAYKNVYVMYSMMMGRVLNVNDEIDQVIRTAAWQRIATLKKAEQMGLTVTNDQIVNAIKGQPIFQNQQTGQYDANAYNAFVSGFLPNAGMTAKGLEALFAENVLIEKASSAAAQGALVTDEEIKKAFHLYTDKHTVDYASIPRTLAGTTIITEEQAKTYFEQNAAQFMMPEKVIVTYVQFPIADYTNTVSITDEMIGQIYEQNKQRYVKPAVEGAPEYQPLEEVKGSIVDVITIEMARRAAANAADTLVAQLSDENTTFEKEAERSGLKVVSNTPAFSATEQVRGVDPTAPFAQAAFNLEKDTTHYYSDPVVGRDFAYVIALHKKLDSFPLTFDMAKADATESARIAAAELAYVKKAEAVHAEIETSLKAGTSFADAASKYNLELNQTIPFDVSTPLEDAFGREIMGATVQFDAGTLVDLISTPDEFLIAYVASKELADEAATLPSMRAQLTASIRNDKAARLAQAWQESVLEEAQLEDLSAKAATDES
ncbi:MAG: SurA N-terminal domain-containing protein [Pontiella sp.]